MKNKILCIIFGVAAIVVLAATVNPGHRIRDYWYVGAGGLDVSDIAIFERTNAIPNTNVTVHWEDILAMTNGLSTTGFVNTAVANSSNLISTTTTTTDNFLTNWINSVSNLVGVSSSNNVTVAPGANVTVVTNGSGGKTIYTVSASSSFAALEVQTNGVRAGLVTNVNFANGVTGMVSSSTATLGLSAGATLSGSTNFINLSAQAAKLPTTNYPGIDAGWQDWELVYYKTNAEGNIASLNSSWQFIVPQDYATNSMLVRIYSALSSTNGPNTSNTIFRASVLRATPSDAAVDLHTNVFGATLSGTNTWAASYVGTNKMQSVTIALGTNSMLAPGDLCLLKLDRNGTADTFGGVTSVVGVQLQYTRP